MRANKIIAGLTIAMKWLEALKKWNASRGGRYTVPRKGTAEHAEVCAMMEGGAKKRPPSKASGYVRMLYAKHVNKMTPEDYDPDLLSQYHRVRDPDYVPDIREKKSASRFIPSKVGKPSEFMEKKIESEMITKELKRAKKATMTAPEKASKKTASKGDIRQFLKPKTGGAKKHKAKKSPAVKGYSAAQAASDMKALGVSKKKKDDDKKPPVKESGQISMMMRIGNHVMVAEPQPAVIKVKGNLGELQTDMDAPTSGFTGFENRPKETTRTQASRKFSAEETKVRPLSELFMTKPSKGLVEEQLQGKGCWWMRELEEF